MRKTLLIIALILVLPQFYSYDVIRYNHNTITTEMNNLHSFTEQYNDLGLWRAYSVYGRELIESRAPDMRINSWHFTRNDTLIELGATGEYPNLITRTSGNTYKIGGRGYLDDYCNNPVGTKNPIKQLIITETTVPPEFEVKETPENYLITTPAITLSYRAEFSGNTLRETIDFSVTETVTGKEYCEQRELTEEAVTQGLMISTPSRPEEFLMWPVTLAALSTALLITLLTTLAFKRVNKK